jgi:hypothetical protein
LACGLEGVPWWGFMSRNDTVIYTNGAVTRSALAN